MSEPAGRGKRDVKGAVLTLLVVLSLPALLAGALLTYVGADDLYANGVNCDDTVITPDRFSEVACTPSYVSGVSGDLESINQRDFARQRETGRDFLMIGLSLLVFVLAVAFVGVIRYVRWKRRA